MEKIIIKKLRKIKRELLKIYKNEIWYLDISSVRLYD